VFGVAHPISIDSKPWSLSLLAVKAKRSTRGPQSSFLCIKGSLYTGQIANLPQPMDEQMIQCFVETGQLSFCYPDGHALKIGFLAHTHMHI